MSTLSWQAGNASGSFLTGTIVQALLVVNYPNYTPEAWQGTLLVFAMVLVLFIVNIWGASVWARVQNGLMVLHILFFLIVIIILWVMAPHQSAKAVFTEFTNEGGWSSMGLSVLVGQITAIYSLLGTQEYILLYNSLLINTRLRCNCSYCRRSQRRRPICSHFNFLELHRQRCNGRDSARYLSILHRVGGRRTQ